MQSAVFLLVFFKGHLFVFYEMCCSLPDLCVKPVNQREFNFHINVLYNAALSSNEFHLSSTDS